MQKEQRRTVRLELNRGFVRIRYCGVAAFLGTLVDISEGGCCCCVAPQSQQSQLAKEKPDLETWLSILAPGMSLQVEISLESELGFFHSDAVLAHARAVPGQGLRMGLRFSNLSPARTTQLRAKLLGIALAACRQGPPPAPAASDDQPRSTPTQTSTRIVRLQKLFERVLFQEPSRDGREVRPPKSHSARIVMSSACRLLLQYRATRPQDVCEALAKEWSLPVAALGEFETIQRFQRIFSYLVLRRFEFIPFAETKERLCLAAAFPLSEGVVNELEQLCNRRLQVYLAPADQIHRIQNRMRPRGPYQERQHARVRVRVPAVFQFLKQDDVNLDDAERQGVILNMSEAGFLISGPGEAELDPADLISRELKVRIRFATNFGDVEAICQARHISAYRQAPDPQTFWNVGVEILAIDKLAADALKDTCANAAIDQNKRRGSLAFA